MPTVALRAHFDGDRILLDEPFPLPVAAPLIVTVLPSSLPLDADFETNWLRTASNGDAFAFLADPSEEIYTLNDGEPLRDAL